MRNRIIFFLVAFALIIPAALSIRPGIAFAAANLSVSGPSAITVGDTVTLTITVSTSDSANAFQGTLSYPSGQFDPVRGTFSGSICTLPITVPDPLGGTATFSCGKPSGFSGTGTVATIVLKATASGAGSFGLSGCQVLANDGQGTDITGGCSGKSFTASDPVIVATPTPTPPPAAAATAQATPPPAAATTTTAKSTPTPSPKATSTPKSTPTPVAAETPKQEVATATPVPPPVQTLAPTATPAPGSIATPASGTVSTNNAPPRTIAQAIQAILASSKDLKSLHTSPAGVIALMVTTIPFLALVMAILFLAFRLYNMESRRRRTLDRLFEMELSELAALEGKLDLLAEKGP